MTAKRISVTEACGRVEGVLESLEDSYREYPEQLSGTQIARVALDRKQYAKHGIPIGHRGPVWCLRMGSINEPRIEFYGVTILDCLAKAQNGRRQLTEAV